MCGTFCNFELRKHSDRYILFALAFLPQCIRALGDSSFGGNGRIICTGILKGINPKMQGAYVDLRPPTAARCGKSYTTARQRRFASDRRRDARRAPRREPGCALGYLPGCGLDDWSWIPKSCDKTEHLNGFSPPTTPEADEVARSNLTSSPTTASPVQEIKKTASPA